MGGSGNSAAHSAFSRSTPGSPLPRNAQTKPGEAELIKSFSNPDLPGSFDGWQTMFKRRNSLDHALIFILAGL